MIGLGGEGGLGGMVEEIKGGYEVVKLKVDPSGCYFWSGPFFHLSRCVLRLMWVSFAEDIEIWVTAENAYSERVC